MKLYIVGKINGLENYKEKFKKAEDKLTEEGHICMNPAVLPEGFPYESYMPICCAMIDQCDAVYMLNNWEDSKGAKVEREYALVTNKPVHYECVMKFYEFNNFGYYALIGAETEEEAVKYYAETVADIEEDDGPPDEITKEEARAKLIGGCKEDEDEALQEFDKYTSKQDPYLVLIDSYLV